MKEKKDDENEMRNLICYFNLEKFAIMINFSLQFGKLLKILSFYIEN